MRVCKNRIYIKFECHLGKKLDKYSATPQKKNLGNKFAVVANANATTEETIFKQKDN